jgi:hypothetical protein
LKKPLAFDSSTGIDLHLHSTASDGTLTPAEIIKEAVRIGLKAIAITDHDTLAGSSAAFSSGIPSSLQFLSGVEISAEAPAGFQVKGSVHILGYGIDYDNLKLNAILDVLKHSRENRSPKIIKRLNALGMRLEDEELVAIVGDGMAGRPHIAQLMMKKGMVASVEEAFDRYLGKHKPAYVGKYRVAMKETIEAIEDAGGVAVLAHPFLYGLNDPKRFEAFLDTLISMGLKGIEAIYPDHDQEASDGYCNLARKHNLLITGGTDFHGDITPLLRMGSGNGNFHVPYRYFEILVKAISREKDARSPADRLPHTDLEQALGYRFEEGEKLTAALRHSSYVNEQPDTDLVSNERLEFLGDAVLNLAVSHLLMVRYPDLAEGDLSRNRANLVNENQLAEIAREIGLGPHLLLGKGEALTDGREKNSILADTTEAIIAAIYLDGGFDAAFAFVESHLHERLRTATQTHYKTDFKSKLQEFVQSVYHEVPRYKVVGEQGPDHNKIFRVRVTVAGIAAEGEGKSKKLAEQAAARAGLGLLESPV